MMFIDLDINPTPLTKNYTPNNLFTTSSKYPENNNFFLVTEGNEENKKNIENIRSKTDKFEKVKT